MNLLPIWAQGNLGEAENTSCHRAEMKGPPFLGSPVVRAGLGNQKLSPSPHFLRCSGTEEIHELGAHNMEMGRRLPEDHCRKA